MNRQLNKRCVEPGFTLIELLVVIATIAVLAALLLPTVAGAKRRAREVHCLNNVRELSLAGFMYANEHGRPVLYDSTPGVPGGIWMGSLKDYCANNRALFICPTAPLQQPAPTEGNHLGTADKAWVRWTHDAQTMFYGGYGYNAWLYSDVYKYYPQSMPEAWVFTTESSIRNPASTPVFVDANWVDLSPQENDSPWPDLYAGAPFGAHASLGHCTISRHGVSSPSRAPRKLMPGAKMPGAVMMGMMDGHARLVKLEDLWNYDWHVDWRAPAKRL